MPFEDAYRFDERQPQLVPGEPDRPRPRSSLRSPAMSDANADRPPEHGPRVETEVRDHVLVITMVRHAKRNAIDGAMTLALDGALNRLEDDPDLWVAVLTGGPDMFCAGTDMAATSGPPTERGGVYGVVGRTRTKPLIAAVEGIAYGGGFEVVMACDLVVAATTARFALPEVKRGLVATSGALFRASRVLPLNVAKELLVTGADLSPADAQRHGLVNRLTAPGGALEGAIALAGEITANAPIPVQQSIQVVDALASADDGRGWELTRAARRIIGESEDSREGVAAFFEKRPPRWTGA
jgi:enoyl-CoA hydratase/carnithine racemase